MTDQKSMILDVTGNGTVTLDTLLTKVKKKQPNIKRDTLRGRLSELRQDNQIIKQANGFRKII